MHESLRGGSSLFLVAVASEFLGLIQYRNFWGFRGFSGV